MLFAQPSDRFRPYLLTGERVFWCGQPKQGIVLSPRDTFLIPFSLLWGGFAIFWNVSAWRAVPDDGYGLFFRLWGLPFLAIGLYFIVGRFFYDAWLRRRLFYAVTDRRVLIFRSEPFPRLTSRDIPSLPLLELSEHRDGTGTVAFDRDEVAFAMFVMRRHFYGWTPPANAQFFRIADPRKVYELIRDKLIPELPPHAPAPASASAAPPG